MGHGTACARALSHTCAHLSTVKTLSTLCWAGDDRLIDHAALASHTDVLRPAPVQIVVGGTSAVAPMWAAWKSLTDGVAGKVLPFSAQVRRCRALDGLFRHPLSSEPW